MRATKAELLEWINGERSSLWTDFTHAAERAIKPPNPFSQRTWSIEMESLGWRIAEAKRLCGDVPTPWDVLPWNAWPYYPEVEGAEIPGVGWDWLEGHAAKQRNEGHTLGSAVWALQYRYQYRPVNA